MANRETRRSSTSKQFEFNADKRAEERLSSSITVGGRHFRPRKKTSNVMEAWIDTSPDRRGDEENLTKEQQKEGLRNLNEQLAVLIAPIGEDGSVSPDDDVHNEAAREEVAKHLSAHLDMEDATELLEALSPSAEEEEAARRD